MASDPFALPGMGGPGWFGKLPALGDFATRRLPERFTSRWDAWLSQNLAASQSALGDRWLEVYLSGPVWSFALLPGSVDASTWYGVMMPSVDRVGRYYPLTLAASTDYAIPPANLDDWMNRLRDTALACLDPQATIEQLDATLAPQILMPAEPGPEAALPADAHPARWLAHPAGLASTLAETGSRLLWRSLSGSTLWWTSAPPAGYTARTGLLACRGLPDARAFQSLLEGRFE
jgi:type VI secretion system protein ImpM